MALTIMRKTFKKVRLRIINSWSFKPNQIYVSNGDGFNKFCKISAYVLNSFAPTNKKLVRASQEPFITKEISKEIMERSRLRNNFFKKRKQKNKQRKPVSFR